MYSFKVLFIYFWLPWVFTAAGRLFSSCRERGLLSSWLLSSWSMGSRAWAK